LVEAFCVLVEGQAASAGLVLQAVDFDDQGLRVRFSV
jgi:hypothetical protein